MRSRAVPVLVALANTDNATVSHVNRNEELFSGFRRDSTLAYHVRAKLNVVVNRLECTKRVPAHFINEGGSDSISVEDCETLTDLHVMKVVFTVFPGEVAKLLRNAERVRVELAVKLCNGFLNLRLASLCLIVGNQFFLHSVEFVLTLHNLDSKVLIMLRHLFTQVAATCVDNQILRTFGVGVDFDEMITAAESANTALKSFGVLEFPEAPKLLEFIEADTASLMHVASTRNALADSRVESGIVDFDVAKLHGQHTTANIHTHDVRDNLVSEVCGESDYTASTSVYVRHDTHFAVCERWLLHESVNLIQSFGFDIFSEDFKITHCRSSL